MCYVLRARARGDARELSSLFAFYLQIESQAVLVRYVEIASAPPPLAAPASARARARAWGRGSPDFARSRSGFGAREPHHSADFTRMPAHALYRQHTPRTFPREGDAAICTHYIHDFHVGSYTNLKSLLRELRASRLSTGIYCAPAARVWVSTGRLRRPAPAARIGY